jgi:hypothetical protein
MSRSSTDHAPDEASRFSAPCISPAPGLGSPDTYPPRQETASRPERKGVGGLAGRFPMCWLGRMDRLRGRSIPSRADCSDQGRSITLAQEPCPHSGPVRGSPGQLTGPRSPAVCVSAADRAPLDQWISWIPPSEVARIWDGRTSSEFGRTSESTSPPNADNYYSRNNRIFPTPWAQPAQGTKKSDHGRDDLGLGLYGKDPCESHSSWPCSP